MENYLESLNKQQLQAVTTSSQYVRIVAGAGSGKTRVLTTRIAYLIENWGISPESILAITFTNKAANEMKVRIESQLNGNNAGVHISTIHSFCVTFLRQEIRRENYPSNFTILDVDDQKAIIKEALKEKGLSSKDYSLNLVLDFIAGNKVAGINPDEAKKRALSPKYEKMADLYEYYLERCQQLYGLDFDDLLLWSVRILKKYPQVRSKWQQKFHFILVDEFQDIDDVQAELINLLVCSDTYLYVVGDPDQTIYSWRGANINIIMGFDKKYEGCETIILNQNYRSTKMILNGANSLIKYNNNRVKKDLFTKNKEGDKILHFTAGSEEGEAGFVVGQMQKLLKAGQSYQSMAVLYRSSYLSRFIEKQLIDFKIPYVIFGGIRFYERAEVKDMLSYLRLLTTKDDLSFKRVVNTPKRSIGEKTIDSLFAASRAHGISLYEGVDYFDGSSKTKARLQGFKDQIDDWTTRSQQQPIEKTFQMVFEESGYKAMLEDTSDPKNEERLENVKELLNDVIGFENSHPELGLDEYLANVALYTDIQDNNNGDHVSLMTIHASKGLEFDNVFVIGLSEGIFPSERSVLESGKAGLEEERRLAYVAFTRAKKRLCLSDNNGYSYSSQTSKTTSRFVEEIDEQYIRHLGMNTPARPAASPAASGFYGSSSKPVSKKSRYKAGDVVVHEVFGEGIVREISEDRKYGIIMFPYPYMTKTLALDFPKMHKKED